MSYTKEQITEAFKKWFDRQIELEGPEFTGTVTEMSHIESADYLCDLMDADKTTEQ